MRTVIAITGASGSIYGVEFLKKCPGEKYLILSKWGQMVLKDETGLTPKDLQPYVNKILPENNLASPFASGSNAFDALVVVPCSVTTLGRIACGIADSLITRAAYVAMKEKRKMVLALRETPLATVTLEQAATLSRDGVIIMPACPPFYNKPKTLEESVDGFVNKILGVLGHDAGPGWRQDDL